MQFIKDNDDLALVPQTGQTISYGNRDDGSLKEGVEWSAETRFTDNGNGTVTDNLTKLIWLKNANCAGTKNWNDALAFANNLKSGDCGLSDGSKAGDWRLPNLRELHSLIDYGRSKPALPEGHPLTNVQLRYYWSSTTLWSNTGSGWYVGLRYGYVSYASKTVHRYDVWPVRGGQ